MTDTDVAPELQHVPFLKNVAHQAAAFALKQLTLGAGHDARGVLTAVLEDG
jgi:hypothetical protein